MALLKPITTRRLAFLTIRFEGFKLRIPTQIRINEILDRIRGYLITKLHRHHSLLWEIYSRKQWHCIVQADVFSQHISRVGTVYSDEEHYMFEWLFLYTRVFRRGVVEVHGFVVG